MTIYLNILSRKLHNIYERTQKISIVEEGAALDISLLPSCFMYSCSQTMDQRLSTPYESAINQFCGQVYLLARWGRGGACASYLPTFRHPSDFTSICYKLDSNAHITVRPGVNESFAGLDYDLIWLDHETNNKYVLARVGITPFRGSWAIVKMGSFVFKLQV